MKCCAFRLFIKNIKWVISKTSFAILFSYLQNSPLRPSPPTHPSSQPSPHSQPPPPHSQIMPSQPFMGPRYPAGPRPVRLPQLGGDFNGVCMSSLRNIHLCKTAIYTTLNIWESFAINFRIFNRYLHKILGFYISQPCGFLNICQSFMINFWTLAVSFGIFFYDW